MPDFSPLLAGLPLAPPLLPDWWGFVARIRSIFGIWNDGRRPGKCLCCGTWGVDENHIGKKDKFITVVSNLETSEPVWFGREGKKETIGAFFATQSKLQLSRIQSACVDMWEPYTQSILQHAPQSLVVTPVRL